MTIPAASLPPKAVLTSEQKYAMEVALVGFMAACPFFCHYFYSSMEEYPTLAVPTAATDGRRIFYNPEYMQGLKPPERVFVLAHEVHHVVCLHPQRMKNYDMAGAIGKTPFDRQTFNVAADYVINADLVETGVGVCNPSWLFDPKFKSADLAEDVYETIWKKKPKGNGKGQHAPADGKGTTKGGAGKGDQRADANGGAFDTVMNPATDPVTGAEDVPDPAEFREAIARAAAAAKAMGNMPANFQRIVAEVMEPQINWKDRLRMLVAGRIGSRRETWTKPNRRRLALNPVVIVPGRMGNGSNLVVVAADTSGSVSDEELAAYFGEMSGILADCRPKLALVLGCDARINSVHEVTNGEDLAFVRGKGLGGGGGTSFVPVFDYIAKHNLRPDALIYLTDMMGQFPGKAPAYPVIWAATTDTVGPFGETVRVKVGA